MGVEKTFLDIYISLSSVRAVLVTGSRQPGGRDCQRFRDGAGGGRDYLEGWRAGGWLTLAEYGKFTAQIMTSATLSEFTVILKDKARAAGIRRGF
jgi:hypothetical protein